MSIRVVVVDDEKPARDRIRRMLAGHHDFTLVGEAENARRAVELIDREKPDLCLLDVQMPGGDGFQVLRRVRHLPRVVFTTAFDQYAVRAFEVNSLDYLLKPFDRSRFAEALDRVREALRREAAPDAALLGLLEQLRSGMPAVKALGDRPRREPSSLRERPAGDPPERIPARRGARIVLLDPVEVLCFESEDALVFARTPRGRFLVETTLADLEARLAPRFFRSHRCCLVNLARVGEILPGDSGTFRIVLDDDAATTVPLSRRQARRLRERIPW